MIKFTVMDIPVPKIGIPVSLDLARDKKIMFQSQLSPISLPTTYDFPLKILFDMITVENVVKIIISILSEQKIIFLSSKKFVVSFVIQSIVSLIYPFAWHHAFVPILPKLLLDFLHSPMPFIMGIERSIFHPSYRSILNVKKLFFFLFNFLFYFIQEAVIIDLDSNNIEWPTEGIFIGEPQLFEPFTELKTTVSKHILGDFSISDNFEYFFEEKKSEINSTLIRLAFVKCFSKLMSGYRSSMNYLRLLPKPRLVIDLKKYTQGKTKEFSNFFENFVQTQSFAIFKDEHACPKSDLFDWIQYNNYQSLPFTNFVNIYLEMQSMVPQNQVLVSPKFNHSIKYGVDVHNIWPLVEIEKECFDFKENPSFKKDRNFKKVQNYFYDFVIEKHDKSIKNFYFEGELKQSSNSEECSRITELLLSFLVLEECEQNQELFQIKINLLYSYTKSKLMRIHFLRTLFKGEMKLLELTRHIKMNEGVFHGDGVWDTQGDDVIHDYSYLMFYISRKKLIEISLMSAETLFTLFSQMINDAEKEEDYNTVFLIFICSSLFITNGSIGHPK